MSLNLCQLFSSGILLLHNFEYNGAKEIFLNIQKYYPKFVLGYWAESMTYNHPLWDEEDITSARNALNKLASTPAQRLNLTINSREKGLIYSVNLLYGDGSKDQRNQAYTQALAELYQQYPTDDDIGSFYALSILGLHRGNRNIHDYLKAAKILKPILKRNPNHQGALHYYIHCLDDREHAHLALNAALKFESLSPLSAHARHMPSHIYLALELWDDVVRANRYSLEAHLNDIEYDIHYLHSLQWLHYAYLRLNRFDQAIQTVSYMYHLVTSHHIPIYIWYYNQMRATHIVITNDYNISLPEINYDQLEISAIASTIYANSLIDLYKYNNDIRPNITKLQILLQQRRQQYSQKQTNDDYFTSVNENGLNVSKVVINQLNAHYLRSVGQLKDAIQLLKLTITFENTLPKDYGPPNPPHPTKKLLEEFLSP